MDASKDMGAKPENLHPIPEKLVWAIILMGMMMLITFVSV
jgi:hypothetical protein